MNRGLIIDFGGVLTNPFDESMRAFCLTEGIEPNALRTALTAHAALVADLERGKATQAEFAATIGLALRIFPDDLVQRITAGLELQQDVMAAVARVRQRGVQVAVLSNSLGSEPYNLFDRFRLKVDVIVASDQVRMRKPDPEIYRLTADRLGIPPAECVYVDDSAKFLDPAAAFGMTTVLATSPAVTIKALEDLFG
ncbi:HAD family phosphatase [Lentzea sp. NBRC 105346]|uniref:HAD family hydrolase n=1 Tax=Lentzea sp. NBRC 105346 TaxID=3032205 RepID=UPI002557172A|nr:HAD family phosphatase [Lentzea sp. NBRC 105346]